MAGLATKIVFGGCDQRTAEFFGRLSGQQTLAVASLSHSGHFASDSATASLRSRALLLPDDIIRPAKGHATIFAAYGGRKGADQAIFHAKLTAFFQRKDWKLAQVQPKEPLTVPRPVKAQSERRQPGPSNPELDLPDQALELVEQWASSQRQRRRHDGQETARGHSGQTDIFESETDA
jgi:type IV secretory pathway TraG/TraD family ATPase VirD4